MKELIAVIDDEEDIRRLVSLHLKKSRYRVEQFKDASGFYRFLESKIPDMLILDLMLPDEDGLEICKRMKRDEKYMAIPIIMLTAKTEEVDRIVGLELGADDYVTKPFSPRELVARVKAVLRRNRNSDIDNKVMIGDYFELDSRSYTVRIHGERIYLTTTEFKLVQLLTSRVGWVFSRDQILEHLWNNEKYVIDRTVDVHIRHLRKKLGKYGSIIKNVRGVGYKIEP